MPIDGCDYCGGKVTRDVSALQALRVHLVTVTWGYALRASPQAVIFRAFSPGKRIKRRDAAATFTAQRAMDISVF